MNSTQYKCDFSVNNRHMTQIVYANNEMDAKRMIEMQYRGCKIQWWNTRRVK